MGGGGSGWGRGVWQGEGGQGTFQSSCHYCTTTWCFALKGLRTITRVSTVQLHLDHNSLTAVPSLSSLTALVDLRLQSNHITSLGPLDFVNHPSLV